MTNPKVETLLKQLRELVDGLNAPDLEKRKYRFGLIHGVGIGACMSKNTDLANAAFLLMLEEVRKP